MTASAIIMKLKSTFGRNVTLEVLMSSNVPYKSSLLLGITKERGIELQTSSSIYP